ncbi:hypothetical protein COY32_05395 [candidate division WWE3 bacterium CG_4_10_14_0_2_um_filter_41_14]|uniref:SD-repeat containing protein B domain-containing protein n=1 Tax=candidate division WWE3 bacterium CG_4_10_14_0_2_um_filter_41_14 TaxID=1975072 RepID=A0A2M7TGS5_UNCKA|nr:MAG: hypothetical protein COY32_05395 [candidate division WWE3 bacterium CG_4_10_14_0_2_um_filter_41_14]
MKHTYLLPLLLFVCASSIMLAFPDSVEAYNVCYLDNTYPDVEWGPVACKDPGKDIFGPNFANNNPSTVILRHQDGCGSIYYTYRIRPQGSAWSKTICYDDWPYNATYCPSGSIHLRNVGDTYTDPATNFKYTLARKDGIKDVYVENLSPTCRPYEVELFTTLENCTDPEAWVQQTYTYNFTTAGCKLGNVNSCTTSASISNQTVLIRNSKGQSETVSTDANGNYFSNTIVPGPYYAMGPQTPVSGYVPPAKTTTQYYAWNQTFGYDQPLNSATYESQPIVNGCAGPNNSNVTGRCNFCLNPTTPVNTPTQAPATPTPIPAVFCYADAYGSATTLVGDITIVGDTFDDLNSNCIKDAGEPAYTSATLKLDQLSPASCTTNANLSPNSYAAGNYTFSGLSCFGGGTSASFRLRVSTPEAGKIACTSQYTTPTLTAGTTHTVTPIGIRTLQASWFNGSGASICSVNDISSPLPAGKLLIETHASYGSGLAIAGGTVDVGDGNVSASGNKIEGYTSNLHFNLNTLAKDLIKSADRTNPVGTPQISHDDSSKPYPGVVIYHFTSVSPSLSGDWENINFPLIIIADADISIGNTIANNKITLDPTAPHAFFAVIANGNIIIDQVVGSESASDGSVHLEGIYMAGENITDGGGSKRLNIFGGVYTGLLGSTGTYVMDREYTNRDAETYPSNTVTFNPKLLLNLPTILADPRYEWAEVKE